MQIPYYKEGLEGVLKPTVRSLKAAIATYEMQGGTANIIVHDDGIQIISEEERAERKEFYEENNIGWTARPAHKAKLNLKGVETTFLRKGKFKKASNMNFGMWISCRVEEKLVARQLDTWTASDEAFAYQECMKEVLEEDEGTSWAEGMWCRFAAGLCSLTYRQATFDSATTSSSSTLIPAYRKTVCSMQPARWNSTQTLLSCNMLQA